MEPFPSNPYAVEIYNAAGTRLGNPVQLTIAPDTQRILVGTAAADTAFGTTRDATLPATLPADGQACFKIANANVKIMCLAWGCIQTQIVAPVMVRAPSPPNDQSVQRQSTGVYQLATPTPDAANVAGTMASNCPTEPDAAPLLDGPITPDSGVSGGSSGIDAGGGNNNNGDDGGGCCQVDARAARLARCCSRSVSCSRCAGLVLANRKSFARAAVIQRADRDRGEVTAK